MGAFSPVSKDKDNESNVRGGGSGTSSSSHDKHHDGLPSERHIRDDTEAATTQKYNDRSADSINENKLKEDEPKEEERINQETNVVKEKEVTESPNETNNHNDEENKKNNDAITNDKTNSTRKSVFEIEHPEIVQMENKDKQVNFKAKAVIVENEGKIDLASPIDIDELKAEKVNHKSDHYEFESLENESDSEGYDFDVGLDENTGFFSGATRRLNKQYNNWMWYLRSRRTGGDKEFKSGRLLDRDNAFHQSTGLMHVSHFAKGETRSQVLALYSDDWFHVLLSLETHKIMLLLSILVTLVYLFFALMFLWVDRSNEACNMGHDGRRLSFQGAFAFSLITSSTVGYGFPGSGDPFFFDCPGLLTVVYFQVVVSLMVNAFVVGLILQRVGRADTRCHQVVFSDKACIRCIGGHFYFTHQVYDLDRRHPVVEAHVRCYAVFHETDGANTALFQTRFMRLQNPNDELGGVLFLSVPCTVVHQIDQWSPLLPPKESRIWENYNDNFVHNSSNRYVFPGLILREADAECGDRSGASCPICGESFQTEMHLMRHIRYMRNQEELEEKDRAKMKSYNPSRKYTPSPLPTGSITTMKTQKKNALANTKASEVHRVSDVPDSDIDTDNTTDYHEHEHEHEAHERNRGSLGRRKIPPSNAKKYSRLRKSAIKQRDKRKLYRNQKSTEGAVFLPRGGGSVDSHLVEYADLTRPMSHQDVDFSLLQTDIHLVPGKDNQNTLEDLFVPLDNKSTRNVNEKNNLYLKLKTRRVEDLRDAIRDHVTNSKLEIVVLVEGIEARSSNTFQARHSYTHENIVFDKFFATCMEVSSNGHAQVNLNHFHTCVPVPSYVEESAPVQSHS